MKHRALTLLTALLLTACVEQGELAIDTPYAFATAPGAKNGAAFLIIENKGPDDTLVAAKADIADRTEIHDMQMQDGIMQMRRIDTLIVPNGEQIELAPGGKHIMFLDLNAPLAEGTAFDLTLTFLKAGEMTFPVQVVAPGQKPDGDMHEHDHHEHDGHDHH